MNLKELIGMQSKLSVNRILHFLGDNTATEYNIDDDRVISLIEIDSHKYTLILYPEAKRDLDSAYKIYSIKCPEAAQIDMNDLIDGHINVGKFADIAVSFKSNSVVLFYLGGGRLTDIVEMSKEREAINLFLERYGDSIPSEIKLLMMDSIRAVA